MATTTNFGWETPDDTDLVKDGAAAIRTVANSIDTSFVDLKGGTTGQILSKASNTDLDYAWITNDVGDITAVTAGTGISGGGTAGAVTITNDMATKIDAKGDLIVGTGADTYDRLAVGTNGHLLTADSTAATGMKWAAAPSSDSLTLISTTTLSGATSTTIGSIPTTYNHLYILIEDWGANAGANCRFNLGSSGFSVLIDSRTTMTATTGSVTYQGGATESIVANNCSAAAGTDGFQCAIYAPNYSSSSSRKTFHYYTGYSDNTNGQGAQFGMSAMRNGPSAAITQVTISSSSGNHSGTVKVYGWK